MRNLTQRKGVAGNKQDKMSNYSFKNPSLWKGVTADQAAEELNRIRDEKGCLKAEFVVEAARPKDSVLHKCFEWDDKKAAELYRLRTAGDLIRNLCVEIINEELKVHTRAFVNVREEPDSERSYAPIVEAIQNEESYKDLLEQARADADAFVKKYSQIQELNKIKQELLKFINGVI